MKTPLRYQVTEFDCGTVSLQNAISYLFDREEIPAELIKAIHKYTLDCYDDKGNLGQGGTSKEAIKRLSHWITRYANEHEFNIICKRLEGKDITLDKLYDCLNNNGCIFLRSWQEQEHYIIITKIKNNKVYIFDPYYMNKLAYNKDKEVKVVANKPFTHNRIVSLKRLFSESKLDFSMGTTSNRECVLINRK